MLVRRLHNRAFRTHRRLRSNFNFNLISNFSKRELSSAQPLPERCNNYRMAAQPDSAVARVFGVVELTEKIIVNNNFIDLLRCQRVSRHFQQVIKGSLALQRKLHLAPEPSTGNEEKRPLPRLPKIITIDRLPSFKFLKRRLPSASYQEMLNTQPPVLKVICYTKTAHAFDRCTFSRGGDVEVTVESDTGVTIGEVFKGVEKHIEMLCKCPRRRLRRGAQLEPESTIALLLSREGPLWQQRRRKIIKGTVHSELLRT